MAFFDIDWRGGDTFTVTWHAGPDGPEAFYLRLGFTPTGEPSGHRPVGVLDVPPA